MSKFRSIVTTSLLVLALPLSGYAIQKGDNYLSPSPANSVEVAKNDVALKTDLQTEEKEKLEPIKFELDKSVVDRSDSISNEHNVVASRSLPKEPVAVQKQQPQEVQKEVVAQPQPKPQPKAEVAKAEPQTSKGRILNVTATAYGADCAGCSGVTATGVNVKNSTPNIIAVDPRVIPLHSRVLIDGKIYRAEDTGGAIKGNRIDILYPSEASASSYGRQHIQIKILD